MILEALNTGDKVKPSAQYGGLKHQSTETNYATVPLTKGKTARKRPIVNIDMATVKSQIGMKSNNNSTKSCGPTAIIKSMPKVEVGNVDAGSDCSGPG